MRFKLDFSYDDCFLSYAEENQWLNHGKLYESLNFYGILLEFTMYYQSVTVSSIFGVKNFRAPLVSYKRVFFKKTKIRVLSVRRNVNTATSLEISAVSSRKLGHFLFWYCTFHFVTPGEGGRYSPKTWYGDLPRFRVPFFKILVPSRVPFFTVSHT